MNAVATHQVTDMERMARAFAASKLFGVQNVEQALALCLIAQAEGRHPATAAQDYHILQGRPAKKADAMLRDFLGGGGKVEWHELSDAKADATFSHPAGGSARIDWTMERAKKAQLTTAMWTKYPRQMLRARVVSEGVRTVYPMATSGMYVPEEVAEFTPAPVAPQSAPDAIADMRDVTPRDARKVLNPETGRMVDPMSSNQAKKDGRAERSAELAHEIPDIQTVAEAAAWRTRNRDEVATWPAKWQTVLWDRFEAHVDDLNAGSGSEPEVVGQDERGNPVYEEAA